MPLGDHRRAELAAWCEKVAAADERGDNVPEWALRRCHLLLSRQGDAH